LNFLTHPPAGYWDYRPAVGPGGNSAVFERAPSSGAQSTLYIITDFASEAAAPFLQGSAPASQTRPDWFWGTVSDAFDIVFNGSQNNTSTVSVWKAGVGERTPQAIASTATYSYPTWGPDGKHLVVRNGSAQAKPSPCNSIIDLSGNVTVANVSGQDPNNTAMFGGMPAINPMDVWLTNLPLIAFAGQPAITGWAGSTSPQPQYVEDYNYIYLNGLISDGGPYRYVSAPMEPDAPLTSFNAAFQGRAPAVSPDGNTVAFESNRDGGYAIYLFDRTTKAVTQVTDPTLNGQHAKFFPGGTKLILCIRSSATSPMAIAWVDISGLLKS